MRICGNTLRPGPTWSGFARFGNAIIPVEKGELASGLYGDGRMAQPETILDFIKNSLAGTPTAADSTPPGNSATGKLTPDSPLAGKKALVTAGPTYEAIDPVRFIGNHSSGKMGIALARELAGRGAQVELVLGPSSEPADNIPGVSLHRVTSAEEMYRTCMDLFPVMDIAVLSAAVADYTPSRPATQKIKKKDGELMIELTRTKDILKTLGSQKRIGQVLVGFALETTGEREYALDN